MLAVHVGVSSLFCLSIMALFLTVQFGGTNSEIGDWLDRLLAIPFEPKLSSYKPLGLNGEEDRNASLC